MRKNKEYLSVIPFQSMPEGKKSRDEDEKEKEKESIPSEVLPA
jgi:hypothetical protein